MDELTITRTSKKINWAGREKILTEQSFYLINCINFILELIIINTLQYNKLTSIDEIFNNTVKTHTEINPDGESDIDIETVENICQALCMNNGVLVNLVKNNISYYKLNHKNYM